MSHSIGFLLLLVSFGWCLQSCTESPEAHSPTEPVPAPAAGATLFPDDAPDIDTAAPEDPMPAPDAGTLFLHTRYDSIRSYPGGGGNFTIAIIPDQEFAGRAILTIAADPALHARLDRSTLCPAKRVAELTVRPDINAAPGLYAITLLATHNGVRYTQALLVRVFEWAQFEPGVEMEKRADFLTWLAAAHPELGEIAAHPVHRYITYPEILIVEHWTFLSSAWDMRICFHVMVPPDDWSMMLLRRTGSLVPLLAARRDSDGSIHEIPVKEYPQLCGY